MTFTARLAALSILASLTATAALAQDGHGGPRPAGAPNRAWGDMHAKMQAMREAHQRQRAQDLRTILRLRPDQEPALTAFLQSHKRPEGPPAGDRRGPPGAAGAPTTTPQRLDEMARRQAERARMMQSRAEALRTFYGALSPEQKQVFDALQRMGGGGRGRGGHGGWGHRGFGGPMGGAPGGPPSRDD